MAPGRNDTYPFLFVTVRRLSTENVGKKCRLVPSNLIISLHSRDEKERQWEFRSSYAFLFHSHLSITQHAGAHRLSFPCTPNHSFIRSFTPSKYIRYSSSSSSKCKNINWGKFNIVTMCPFFCCVSLRGCCFFLVF